MLSSKMWKISFLLIVLLSSTLPKTSACSCIKIETFCETVNLNDPNHEQVIVWGNLTEEIENGIEVTVRQVIAGDVDQEKISVSTLSESFCQPKLGLLQKGKSYVFALNRRNPQAEHPFSIPLCGVPILQVKNRQAVGAVAPGIKRLPIGALSSLANCEVLRAIQVYPNPTTDLLKIRIQLPGTIAGELEIYDSLGRLLVQKAIESNEGTEILQETSTFVDGLYIVKVTVDGISRAFKTVVDHP